MYRYSIQPLSHNYCIVTKEVKLFNNIFGKKLGFIHSTVICDSRNFDIIKLQKRFNDCILTKEVAIPRSQYVKILKDIYPGYSIANLESIGFDIKGYNS